MPQTSASSALADTVLTFRHSEENIRGRLHEIHRDVLAYSRHIRQPDFTRIHVRDLEFLFAAYDERFLAGRCREALDGRKIGFRLAPRMTRSGGMTSRFRARSGEVSFEIAIAVSILFDGFNGIDRRITVCGLECVNRLEALQRIFEHEIVHLAEQLCWETSDCGAPRFQEIAARLFLHRSHTHDLVTRREIAAKSGIHVGSRVSFVFEGRALTGRVNRITKRATVLVEDPEGERFSDGLRYRMYYVPISQLEPERSANPDDRVRRS